MSTARYRLLNHFLHKRTENVDKICTSTILSPPCLNAQCSRAYHGERGAQSDGYRRDSRDDGYQSNRPHRKQFEFPNRPPPHRPHNNNHNNNKQYNTAPTNKLERDFKHIVVPGKISPRRPIPPHIPRPPYADIPGGRVKAPPMEGPFEIKTAASIQGMREACALARKILDFAGTLVKPGVTTDEIDAKVHDAIVDSGAYPSPLGYNGYPKSICTSVNEVAAHGIPDDRPLVEGDIVSIDVTVYYKGFHGDTCDTFFVGEMIDERAKKLVKVARQCRDVGIAILRPGVPIAAIGAAIQNEAMRHKLASIQAMAGHGIGRLFHQRPFIFHCKNDMRGILEPGMTFTIEPVICEGGINTTTWDDKWTMQMKDGGWTAQFEHTVLITETGAEILTQ